MMNIYAHRRFMSMKNQGKSVDKVWLCCYNDNVTNLTNV